MRNELEANDMMDPLTSKRQSKRIIDNTISSILRIVLIAFNSMLIFDDICLHLFHTQFIFYYYELIFNQLLILAIWVTIRNQKTHLNHLYIYIYALSLLIASGIYSILFLNQYSTNIVKRVTQNDLELFFTHELITLGFNLGSIALFYFSSKESVEIVIESTKVEMMASNSGLIA